MYPRCTFILILLILISLGVAEDETIHLTIVITPSVPDRRPDMTEEMSPTDAEILIHQGMRSDGLKQFFGRQVDR